MFSSEDALANRRVAFVVDYRHLMPANGKQARQQLDIPSDKVLDDDELYDYSNHSV